MSLADAQVQVERMMRSGASFESVEAFVEEEPLPALQKSALWLLAWSGQDRRTQRRVAKEALALSAA